MKVQNAFLSIFLFFLLFSCQSPESTADVLKAELQTPNQNLYVIEREIPGAGDLTADELKSISKGSCDVLNKMEVGQIAWIHSYVTEDKVYCVYRAASEELIKEHAEKGGFPANSIQKVESVIDPSTAE